ncbi:branched-chain amino acid ABC transporter permease [Aquabacter spiritensis]|uniref:Amino acid/amide ABC transporter membrane protein 2 (HAAT family) n=1 Tax=Aquabacter spiritensis TaxID=933073 RepID=A0A4R3LZ11_9HYPH|nr:branched-chain amino acid ABC transporter permease [Aquabacter spiritensis]TCT05506.1 amino acid/amide ABC transporter membrane protein 2 (HAAT family) [Aquabacter spiritensis]
MKMPPALPRLIALLILVAVPLVEHNAYWLHVFSLALIAAILALGMQLLLGMAGLLSLGQGAFYGIGAYVAGALAANYGVPFLLTLLAGGLAAAAASLLLVPIVRLKGTSLAVATLGFSIIVHLVILNEEWLTGGSLGLMDIPKPTLFGVSVADDDVFYWVCLVILVLVFVAMDRISKSRFGRALSAICQDEEAARASGIRLAWSKSKCFLVAAFTAGVAGGLFAYHSRYLSPSDFTFNESIEIMIMAVIGGLGSLSGAVVGAFVVVLMPEVLRSSGELRMILFGLAVILLMAAGNLGIVGLASLAAAKLFGLFSSARAWVSKPREAN